MGVNTLDKAANAAGVAHAKPAAKLKRSTRSDRQVGSGTTENDSAAPFPDSSSGTIPAGITLPTNEESVEPKRAAKRKKRRLRKKTEESVATDSSVNKSKFILTDETSTIEETPPAKEEVGRRGS